MGKSKEDVICHNERKVKFGATALGQAKTFPFAGKKMEWFIGEVVGGTGRRGGISPSTQTSYAHIK